MKPANSRTALSALGRDRTRAKKLKALSKAAVAFSSSLDLDRTVSRIAREAARILEFQSATVWLLDDSEQILYLGAANSPHSSPRLKEGDEPRLALSGQDVASLIAGKKPTCLDLAEIPAGLRSLGAVSSEPHPYALIVPLSIGRVPIGLIFLAQRLVDERPSPFEIELASLLAAHAAAAIRNARSVRTVNLNLFETVAKGKREWEQTFDAISDGIFISNSDHVVVRANKSFAAIFGKHPRDIIGKKCFGTIWESGQPCSQCARENLRLRPDRPPTIRSMECVVQGMTWQLTAYPILDFEGRLTDIVHILKQVTTQKRMQELIIRAEKLRAVGEMASGIAHDFNNILSSIIGWSEIMLLGDLPPELHSCAAAIYQAAADGTETVKRIQEYTRIRKDTEFSSVDVNATVRGALELAKPRWKDQPEKAGIAVNVSTEFADIPPAKGNGPDLREVFLNIIFNAIDAMPNGGELGVRTGRHGDSVYASISDSGVGMPAEVQRRVFDPFFTTKGSGGSGLGLSVAYGIVARHGGQLTVESEPGNGSTFSVFLPVAPAVVQESEAAVSQPSRQARILLIDDDESVLRAVEAMLRSEGHAVTKCLGGRQGLARFEEGNYDLVITDLGMPELNGWEVAAKVKDASPDMPVVLLTGWGAEITAERISQLGIDGIVQKPCRLNVLRQTIDEVLGREDGFETVQPVDEQARSSGLLNILIVEDNKLVSDALRQRLEIDGHLVSVAATGQDGLQAFGSQELDLAMIDLKLTDMSGLDVAWRINQIGRRPFVTLMSGDIDGIDESLLRQSGVDATLRKPWKKSELEEILSAARERRRGN
jgi:signal transduction histidine kinase/DNA-binding response OmpR family regulator